MAEKNQFLFLEAEKNGLKEFGMVETFDIENSQLLDYFYEFSSQNAVLSRNNILKARRKIREDEFNSGFLSLFQ